MTKANSSLSFATPTVLKPINKKKTMNVANVSFRLGEIEHLPVADAGIDEAALAGAELELLVREAAGEAIDPPPRWSGWRGEMIVEPLRGTLRTDTQSVPR